MASLDRAQLEQYFDRIKFASELREDGRLASADLALLRALITCQQRAIPFENLSLVHPKAREQDAARTNTDLSSVFEKLVGRRRGGYCFEGNSLLAAALRALGFRLYTTAARVVPEEAQEASGSTEVPLTGLEHQLMLVNLQGRWWAADVGFGSKVPREPVPLKPESDEAHSPAGLRHRVRRGVIGSTLPPEQARQPHREGWYMQSWSEQQRRWQDLYFFQEIEFTPSDYAIANQSIVTSPHHYFQQAPVVAIQTEGGRKTLYGDQLRIFQRPHPGQPMQLAEERRISSGEDRDAALLQHFGISFS